MKKKLIFALSGCAFTVCLMVGAVTVKAGSVSRKSVDIDRCKVTSAKDKDTVYVEYIQKKVAATVREMDGVTECGVKTVINSDNKFTSASVSVTAKNKDDTLGNEVTDYVSKSLNLAPEKVSVTFE